MIEHSDNHVLLRLVSPDGDQGFPGAVTATVRYLVRRNTVRVVMTATTNQATVINMTNHAYLNLGGEGSGTIDGHLLRVDADEYTPVDGTGIPLGSRRPVAGTPLDLREPIRPGEVLRAEHSQIVDARGIDHNYVVHGRGFRRAATLVSPATDTSVEVWADQPGLQVYTGNFRDGTRRSTSGARYRQGDGIALEPQLFPDSPNRDTWPSPVLRSGETYRAASEWRFQSTAYRA